MKRMIIKNVGINSRKGVYFPHFISFTPSKIQGRKVFFPGK
jgi:hypothetical protein